MAGPSETPSPLEGNEGNNGVEVCLFEESPDEFYRAVRAMSELAAGEAEPAFPDTEVQRLASSITFLREWRHFSYEPKGVSFTYGTESASSRHDPHEITSPQFSSASVPKVTHLEDERGNNTVSPDFVLFAGGNVWSLDWCPRLCDKPCSPVNCEYLAVSAHPPGSSYHKICMPLIGRGIIQVWCVVAPFEDAHPHQSMVAYSKNVRRGRPRKIPDGNICSSNPPKPRGRPRKIKSTSSDDPAEPSLKRPRGRPRKYLLSVANGDLALACAMPTVESTPRKGRGRPRKIPVDKIKCLTGIELKENMSTALTSMEPKKKRGRPRKYPSPSISQHASGIGTELGRETGCLPVSIGCNLGHTGYAESNSSLSDATVDATISTPSSSSAICERGKGRHAKNPASTECSCSTTFSSKEQKIQKTPEPSNYRASVENCKKLLVYTRKGVRQSKKTFASNEIKNMEKSSTCIMPNNQLSFIENSKPLGSSISEEIANEAGLVGSKTGVIGYEVLQMNDGNTGNQIVPVQNSSQVIDDVEDTEVAPFKESIKNDNVITCAENSNFSPIPKGIHLPRVVLCLAHNGKVAWDIKWKPPLPNQSEQKSCLGFLAVLLGNGSLEVWEVPSPSMIQKIYSSSSVDGTDPRFLKLQPVFRCAKVKCGNRQSIPLTIDWSPSPHDLILVGCHDGTVALWKFSTDLPSQDSKPFMCVTSDSVPIRALSWAPYVSEEKINTFVTAGEDGLKFWDLRDPYRPLWELTTAPRAVLSLHWLKDARGIVISLEDGTLKFLSLPRIANDVPVTGKPFIGTKTQGVSTYQLSEYLIWSVHVSEITGYAAYCVADGTAVRFHLTSRFWEKEPGKNRVPYFLCGSLAEEGTVIKIGDTLSSPLSNVPLVPKKGPKSFQDVDQACDIEKGKLQSLTNSGYANLELRDGQLGGPDDRQETGALVLADPAVQENVGICNDSAGESLEDFVVFPPKAVALHRLRWNMNKGSERWLCYGGAAGIIRCQRI